MAIEKLDTSKLNVQSSADAEPLKLKPGEVVRNVMITDVTEGESDYGAYTTFTLESMDGDVYSLLVGDGNVFGRTAIKRLTIGPEGSRVLNPKFDDRVLFIGRSEEIPSKKKAGKSYSNFVFGFEE